MAERLIVIGGVAAGMSAASKARRVAKQMEIVVYEKSGYVSYGSCGLPYFIGGVVPKIEDVIVRTPEQFAQKRIEVHVHHEVTAIDVAAHTVSVRNLETGALFDDHWDQLVVTTGGVAARPPFSGFDLEGVFTLRTVEDALAIEQFLEEKKPARGVVVGAGYIGLEMAEALHARGLHVSVLEMLPQALPTLDPEMAALINDELANHDVDLLLEQKVSGFAGAAGRVQRVLTEAGELPAEMVIVAVGVRPAAQLAAQAGIALGVTGGIAVDDHQRTNVPGVFAAGDVAEALNLVTGRPTYLPLGTTANKQGRVAGENAAGGDARFAGIVGTAIVKVFDLEIAQTGLTEKAARREGLAVKTSSITAPNRAHYIPTHNPMHVKLVYEADTRRLLGGQIISSGGTLRIDAVATALHAGWTVDQLRGVDMAYAPPFAPVWDPVLVAANVAK